MITELKPKSGILVNWNENKNWPLETEMILVTYKTT